MVSKVRGVPGWCVSMTMALSSSLANFYARAPHCGKHSLSRPHFVSEAGQRPTNKPAQGKRGTSAALGQQIKNPPSPNGAKQFRAGSIPNVTFINFHAVLPAKRPEFVLKRYRAMMFLLRRNIGADLLDIRLTHRKRTITTLPVKVPVSRPLFLHPFRRTLLGLFHQPGDGDGAGKIAKNVNVIFDAIDQDGLAPDALQDTRHISVQPCTKVRVVEKGGTVLRAEDHMEDDAGE